MKYAGCVFVEGGKELEEWLSAERKRAFQENGVGEKEEYK